MTMPCSKNKMLGIVAIETPGGKRNLNININAQQAILKAYISKQFKLI